MSTMTRYFSILAFVAGCAQPFAGPDERSEEVDATTADASVAAWFPNCVGATSEGLDPTNGCDDGNPCTTDELVDGACRHAVEGYGFACSSDGLMACQSGQCCPVWQAGPIDCHQEGEQAECATGSVCLEGRCWIDCGPGDAACAGTEFPTCSAKSVGSVSVRVCQ